MTAHELQGLLEARPFVPFRLVMRDGTSFEVKDPSWCWVGLASIAIGCPGSAHWTGSDSYYMVPLERIARLDRFLNPAEETKIEDSSSC
jgi:hypothetical protein